MRIKFHCPHCNHLLAVGASAVGKQAKCPSCSQLLTVPEGSVADAETSPADDTSADPSPAHPTAPPPSSAPRPAAGSPFAANVSPAAASSSSGFGGTIYCPQCGRPNDENRVACTSCGFALHGPVAPPYTVNDDGGLSTLIPYKNSQALWAYYLGVFSLMPCLGIPLAIAALITGILGIRRANRHPETRGKIHAWVGVVLGVLSIVGHMVSIYFLTRM